MEFELFPEKVLKIYNKVMDGTYDSYTPEKDIDDLLIDWFSNKCPDKSEYLTQLKNYLKYNNNSMECFLFRLNLDAIIEQVNNDIKIYTNKKGHLFGHGFVGNDFEKNALEITNEELDEQAKNFYYNEETIENHVIGNTVEIRKKIINKICSMGFEPIFDQEPLRKRLEHHLKFNKPDAIIGRIAYLIAMAEIKGESLRLLS